MKVGVVFPQVEFGADAGAIKEWTQTVENLGYTHITAYDHVIGASRATRPDWTGAYDLDSMFEEPFVLFAYMAGFTSKIEFATGVLIPSQRQTVLMAKQAACVDVLCKGRLRLGMGTGWNQVEYEALGVNFADRGKILDDQIILMRELWTKPAVTYKSALHTVTDAGLNPLPVQRPIPIWFGGGGGTHPVRGTPSPGVEKVLRRAAQYGDGWMPACKTDEHGLALIEQFRGYCREYGRDPAKVGMDAIITPGNKPRETWADLFADWKKAGATHLSVSTTNGGLYGPEQHLRRLEEFRTLLPK